MSLEALRDRRFDPKPGTVNAHLHLPPNFSAFPSVSSALDAFRAEGAALIGVSNYYDFEVYAPFVQGCLEAGIAPLLGIEILCRDAALADAGIRANDPGNPGKVYLCGKGLARLDRPSERATELLSGIRRADAARLERMASKLGEIWREAGSDLPNADQIRIQVAERCGVPLGSVVLQERHLAAAAAEELDDAAAERLGLPTDPSARPDAVRSAYLKAGKPAFAEESYVSLEEGIELVRELGGEPAYPVVAETGGELEQDPARLADWILERGIRFAEWIPARNAPATLERYVAVFRDHGLASTAGTEHNTRAMVPIRPRCKGGGPVPTACELHFADTAWAHLARQQEAFA